MDKSYTEKIDKVLKRIRENRKIRGYSHDYMAAMLDISPSAYNKLERNETNLSLESRKVVGYYGYIRTANYRSFRY